MSKDAGEQKLPLTTPTAMVVGGMVGAGVFSIPRNFAQAKPKKSSKDADIH
jgi:arginine:ornithine antiporter / lysine permease